MKIAGFILAAAVVLAAFAAWAGVEVKQDKKNIVAARLEGKWSREEDLTKRLNESGFSSDKIEFKLDPTVAAKIPAKHEEFFKKRRVFAAGTMKVDDKEFPFVLIALGGNPHIIYFRESGGDPMGDTESFYVMLATATDIAKDLLFIGTDMPSGAFAAFERAQEK